MTAEQAPSADRQPTYFHLLSAAEIRDLRPILEVLKQHRDGVLEGWFSRYVEHFGEARTMTADAFREVYGRDLDALIGNLLDGDMEGFEADMRSSACELVDRGVPFAEVVASLHLFEESAAEHFQSRLKVVLRGPAVYLTFDKLSHVRMILLAGTYFAGQQAVAAMRARTVEDEADRLAGGPAGRSSFHGMIGRSAGMRRVYEQIAAAAGGQGAVLIIGETGTGKELAARALHESGGRPGRPFVAVNCAALPRELIESELFGHAKGAYTGAHGEHPGLIRAATGGTVFLDEVTEMAPETQAKLLRVIEERTVRPVGTTRELPVEVRFVASTNRDPEKAVEAHVLRKDLYYRLAVHRLTIPPLRERVEDIEPLCAHFSEVLAERGLKRIDGFDAEALATLRGYSWPGNVRELRNVVELAMTVAKNSRVRAGDLPAHVVRAARPAGEAPTPAQVPTMAAAECDLIRRALLATEGNKLQAAKLLHISRHRLYDKLKKFGIEA